MFYRLNCEKCSSIIIQYEMHPNNVQIILLALYGQYAMHSVKVVKNLVYESETILPRGQYIYFITLSLDLFQMLIILFIYSLF